MASLAREIGVSREAVSQIVNGQTTGATARYSVARALGVRKADLWADERVGVGV